MSRPGFLLTRNNRSPEPSVAGEWCPAHDLPRVAMHDNVTKAQTDGAVDLPLSSSSPNLLFVEKPTTAPLRRTQSFLGLSSALVAPSVRARRLSANSVATQSSLRRVAMSSTVLSPSAPATTANADTANLDIELESGDAKDIITRRDTNRSRKSTGIHLHTMDISQQLRSMSQLSNPTETDSLLSPDHIWNFHRRERSDIGGYTLSFDGSGKEAAGDLPQRVKSPAASSVYSRRSGITDNPPSQSMLAYEIPGRLDGALADWPLKPPGSPLVVEDPNKDNNQKAVREAPPIAVEDTKQSGSASFVTAPNSGDSSLHWQSPQEAAASRKSSSTMLTNQSTSHKFLGRSHSPPKKTIRKRRSIFRFLRPGSRKQTQTRSISTPMLQAVSSGNYDGPPDDPGLLTVHYELPELENQTTRSASMSQLGADRRNPSSSHLAAPSNTPQRRPSLADYERTLTVMGDDRRRPSTVDIRKAQEIREDDHSHRLRRRVSRNKPVDGDTGLMGQALERVQQEKALFHSPSKQFSQSEFPQHHTGAGMRRSVSSFAITTAPSAGTARPRRIGTSLTTWSRYPSHTRAERCASAGHPDAIKTRDFAVHVNPEETHGPTDKAREAETPDSKKSANREHDHKLPKSRSATFDKLLSYYSNIFTTGGSTAQNRRTSVTTGGWLANPDLELLPPPSPSTEHALPHHDHHFRKHLHQLEEHMMQEVEKMEQEVVKVEEEAEKLAGMHPHHHHEHQKHLQPGHQTPQGSPSNQPAATNSRETTPFRHGSIFRTGSGSSRPKRDSMWIDPMDSSEEGAALATGTTAAAIAEDHPTSDDGARDAERKAQLDGADDETTTSSSKADVWSAVYKECLMRPSSAESKDSAIEQQPQHRQPLLPPNAYAADRKAMPPPTLLKSVKPRSPEHAKTLDPKSSVRRFPSVTVVDDRKGHARSVSLISVKVDRDGGIMRSSTHDLVSMIERREREERERLLAG